MKQRPLIQMKDGSVLRPPRYTRYARFLSPSSYCSLASIAKEEGVTEKQAMANLYRLRDSYNITLIVTRTKHNKRIRTNQRSVDRIKILFPYLDERNVYREIK